MTPPTDPQSAGRWTSSAERQAAARDAYRRSVDAGAPISTAALGKMFDRSPRWAQDRIAETRNHRSTTDPERSASGADSSGRAGGAAGRNPHAASGDRPAVAQPIDIFVVAVVALVAAAASYEHQRSLAVLAGEGDLAWVLPISVDGMMLATSRSILRRRRAGVAVPGLSWFGFLLGLAASVAANVAAAEPTLVGRLLAAWPPIALFIAYETLAADHGDLPR